MLQALWLQENLHGGLPAWGLSTLSRGLGGSGEHIEVMIATARNDLRNPDIHANAECYVAYGRKPVVYVICIVLELVEASLALAIWYGSDSLFWPQLEWKSSGITLRR